LPQILGAEQPTLADFITLRRGGWLVTPVVEGRAEVEGRLLRILGIDPLTAPDMLLPEALAPGISTPPSQRPWAAAPGLAEAIGAIPSAGLPPDLIVTEIAEAQRLLGLG